MIEKTNLTVQKAYPNDAGRGIARLDPHTMMQLQLIPSDIIEIEGKKRTVAKVWRAERPDWDKKRILVDTFIRENAGVVVGDEVIVKKVDVKIAKKVILSYNDRKLIQSDGDAEVMVKRQIIKHPIIKDDIIPVMSTMEYPFFGTVLTGQAIPFVVIETEPEGMVIIDYNTEIKPIYKPEKKVDNLSIFLCHSSEDKSKVRKLYQLLQKDGFDPWLDEEKLLPGQDWQIEISKAVKSSDAVIVCLSSKSINKSGYIQKEIKYALDVADEQPEGNIFLIPLKLEKCDVPDRLCRWHWVNFFEDSSYERLIRALHTVEKK